MKSALVVIDDALEYHQAFMTYIKRALQDQVGAVDTIEYMRKKDDRLVEMLEAVIQTHQHVLIVASEEFSFASKVVATICHDALVIKEEMLIPFKTQKFVQDSYLVIKEGTKINVVKVDPFKELPQILLQSKEKSFSFYLFDKQKREIVEEMLRVHELLWEVVYILEDTLFYRVYGMGWSQLESFYEKLHESLWSVVLVGEDLSKIITDILLQEQKSITCAESCTGGLLSSEIVKHSGVSSIFAGSVVTYANEVKHQILSVKESILYNQGAVSYECVSEMLDGVMDRFGADFAMAVSGIAGPNGGTKQKPVGTVFVGAKSRKNGMKIKELHLNGDRTYIRQMSVLWAFRVLLTCDKNFFFKKTKKTLDK